MSTDDLVADLVGDRTPQELCQMWTEALDSGEYTQGNGHLQQAGATSPEFCCWGVLLDKLDPDGWQAVHGDGTAEHRLGMGDDPDLAVILAVGMTIDDMELLEQYNDGTGGKERKNFTEIAQQIRQMAGLTD